MSTCGRRVVHDLPHGYSEAACPLTAGHDEPCAGVAQTFTFCYDTAVYTTWNAWSL